MIVERSDAKLTQAQVREIRTAYKFRTAEQNIYTLAAKYGVSRNTIWRIVKNKTYRELSRYDHLERNSSNL